MYACTSVLASQSGLLYIRPIISKPSVANEACTSHCCDECRSLEEAFKDLRGLMAKAAEMVDLAERFRSTMAAQRKAGQQGSEGTEQADAEAQQWMDTEMQAELVNMGIAGPVTKAESGAHYHQELSRQVQPH